MDIERSEHLPNSNDDILFEGTLVLLYDCDPESPCEDSSACNFGLPGPCTYPGCTDEGACNYDLDAACEGDLCTYDCIGCMDEAACDYDASATLPGECDYSCYGCTDTDACNFDSDATVDEGTCEYCSCGITPMVTATGRRSGWTQYRQCDIAGDRWGIAQCSLRHHSDSLRRRRRPLH